MYEWINERANEERNDNIKKKNSVEIIFMNRNINEVVNESMYERADRCI